MRISTKINLTFITASIIITSTSLFLLYIFAARDLTSRLFEHLKTTAYSKEQNIESIFNGYDNELRLIASRTYVRITLDSLNKNNKPEDRVKLERLLIDSVSPLKDIKDIFIMNSEGKVVASSNPGLEGRDYSQREFFIKGQKETSLSAEHDEFGKEFFYMSGVMMSDEKKNLGILGISYSPDRIYGVFSEYAGLGKTGEAYLIDRNGYMITPGRFRNITLALRPIINDKNYSACLDDLNSKESLLKDTHELVIYNDYRGVRAIGTHMIAPRMQWCLLVKMDQAEVLAPLAKLRVVFLLVVLFISMVTYLIYLLISRLITDPIRKLEKGIAIIGSGNLHHKIEIGTTDEIHELAEAFNTMTENLRHVTTSITNLNKEIDRRKEAEDSLRQSERRYRLLADNATDTIWTMDMELNFTYFSPSVERMRGYSIEEAMAQKLDDFLTPASLELAINTLKEEIANESKPDKDWFRSRTLELEHKCKDGSYIWCEVTMTFIRDLHGNPVGIIGSTRNISKRKKAETDLQLFRNLVNQSSDEIFVVDPKTSRFLDFNERAADNLGYTREELLSKHVVDIDTNITDISGWNNQVESARQKGAYILESTHRRKDDTTFPVEINVSYITLGQNNYILGIVRDISERKRLEQTRLEVQQRYEDLLNNLSVGVYHNTPGAEGHFIEANPALVRMFDADSKEEFLKHSARELYVNPANRLEMSNKVLKYGFIKEEQFEFISFKGRKFFAALTAIRKQSESGDIYFEGIVEDITERRRAEAALKISEEKYRILYESSTDAIMTLEPPEWKFTSGNTATVKMFNVKDEQEFMSLSPWQVSPEYQPDGQLSVEKAKKMLDKAMQEGSNYFEWAHNRYKGEEFSATVLLTRMKIGEKDIIQATVRDISEQKKTQIALIEAEAKYHTLIEEIPAITYIATLDKAKALIYVSPQIEKILGFSPDEYKSDRDLFRRQLHPEDHDRVMAELVISHVSDRSLRTEYRMFSKDGRIVWFRDEAKIVKDTQGNPFYLQGVMYDITERKMMEEGRIMHINDVLTAVRNINKLIVHERDLQYLMKEACDILLKTRGYRMIWIGLVEEKHKRIVPVARCGEGTAFIDAMISALCSLNEGIFQCQCPGSLAINSRKPLLFSNIAVDSRATAWRDIAVNNGLASGIIMPMISGDHILGALNVYAGKPDVFDQEEINLLAELANDLAYALQNIETENQRTLTEGRLQASEIRYRRLFEAAKDGILILDAETGEIVDVNPYLANLLQYDPDELVGKKLWEIGTFKDIAASQDAFGVLQKKEYIRYEDLPLKAKEGKEVPVEFVSNVYNIDIRKVIQCNVRNISERKAAEDKIKQERDRAQNYLDISGVIIISLDREGNVVLINKRGCEILGYNQEEILGKKWSDVFIPEGNKASVKEAFSKLMSGELELAEYFENPILSKSSEERIISWHNIILRDGAGNISGVLSSGEDVTERRRLEHMKDEFVSTVSHELRTPITLMKEGVSLVLDGAVGDINKKQESFLRTVKENADRLERIVNNILDMSKIEAGKIEIKKEAFDVADLIGRLVSIFKLEAKDKGIELKTHFSDPHIKVYADKDKMNQIFMNLISNAMRFTKKGFIEVSAKEKDNEIEFLVSDTGVGIKKEDLPKIFDKFQQFGRCAGPGGRGTGLGLTIVKGLVELHNGRITAQSDIGRGTQIKFSIPKDTKGNK